MSPRVFRNLTHTGYDLDHREGACKTPVFVDVQVGHEKGYTEETVREWDASIPKQGRPHRDPA